MSSASIQPLGLEAASSARFYYTRASLLGADRGRFILLASREPASGLETVSLAPPAANPPALTTPEHDEPCVAEALLVAFKPCGGGLASGVSLLHGGAAQSCITALPSCLHAG